MANAPAKTQTEGSYHNNIIRLSKPILHHHSANLISMGNTLFLAESLKENRLFEKSKSLRLTQVITQLFPSLFLIAALFPRVIQGVM